MNLQDQLNKLDSMYRRGREFESIIPYVNFYRFDWSRFVPVIDIDMNDFNPSFTKCSSDVKKAQSFWMGLYQSLIGKHKDMEANDYCLNNAIRRSGEGVQSVIQFVSSSMTKKQMNELETVASAVLSDFFDVHVVNGDKIKGKDAEMKVREWIRQAKEKDPNRNVWIIAGAMCQRSFSIPEINTVVLTYDKGDKGASLQKMSRALTAGSNKSVGNIVSISIDGNRDDKIAPILLETATKVAEEEGEDVTESLRRVMRTMPIFQLDENGDPYELQYDEYAKEIFNSSNSHRVIVNDEKILGFDMNDLSMSILLQYDEERLEKIKSEVSFELGKKSPDPFERKGSERGEKSIIEEIKKNLSIIADRVEYVIKVISNFSENLTYDQFLGQIDSNPYVMDIIGLNRIQFETLVNEKYINGHLLSILLTV